nr:hypothetical protein GCM10020092_084860 [Actinoplanes digitatis]
MPSLDELDARVERLWQDRLRPYEMNLRLGRHAPHDRALHVVPPDPTWPEQAGRVIARIRHALRPQVGADADVSHIGSTAVPGLPAKDRLDLMLAVPTLEEADRLSDALGGAGLPRREGEWYDNARGLPGKTWPKRMHGNADPGLAGQPARPGDRVARVAIRAAHARPPARGPRGARRVRRGEGTLGRAARRRG